MPFTVLQPIEAKIPASEIAMVIRERRFFSDRILTSYVVNSPGHFEQSVYQKAFESRHLIERVTNKKAKTCRNPKNQRRDRNSILMAHWRMCRNAFITYGKARETESVFPGMAHDQAIRLMVRPL
jgi:hypothetical protein